MPIKQQVSLAKRKIKVCFFMIKVFLVKFIDSKMNFTNYLIVNLKLLGRRSITIVKLDIGIIGCIASLDIQALRQIHF